MQVATFNQIEATILLVLDSLRIFQIGWKPSSEACQAFDAQIRNAEARREDPTVPLRPEDVVRVGRHSLGFRQELDKILVICAGRLLLEMNVIPAADGGPSIARQVWQSWVAATRLAEEWDERERVAKDAAILHRAGARFGLANHPAILKEAKALAEGDRDLRRFMVNGITSAEVVPAPTVSLDTRSAFEQLSDAIPTFSGSEKERLARLLSAERN